MKVSIHHCLDTKDDASSEDALNLLENIDDDLDRINVAMVKVHEDESFTEWGVKEKCSIFYFENGIPNIYSGETNNNLIVNKWFTLDEILGDVANDRELLKWVKRQFEGDDIEDVNAVIVDKITKGEVGNKDVYGDHNIAAVLFCKWSISIFKICYIDNFLDKQGDTVSGKILKAMENIDDECDQNGIIFVKVDTEND